MIPSLLNDRHSVVYGDAATIKTDDAYRKCHIVDTGIYMNPTQAADAMPKHSSFYGTFNYHVDRLKEIGAVQRYWGKYGGTDQVCPETSGKPLSMKQSFTVFLILITGALAGLILLW